MASRVSNNTPGGSGNSPRAPVLVHASSPQNLDEEQEPWPSGVVFSLQLSLHAARHMTAAGGKDATLRQCSLSLSRCQSCLMGMMMPVGKMRLQPCCTTDIAAICKNIGCRPKTPDLTAPGSASMFWIPVNLQCPAASRRVLTSYRTA